MGKEEWMIELEKIPDCKGSVKLKYACNYYIFMFIY